MYRCVTEDGIVGKVICIGIDENQAGHDYNGVGKWCSFTFEEIPQPTQAIQELLVADNMKVTILKVENNEITLRTLEEIQAELAV